MRMDRLTAGIMVVGLVFAAWWITRPIPPDREVPDPTRRQALALVVGLGGFWGAYLPLAWSDPAQVGRVIVAVPVVMASGFWFYGGGVGSVVAASRGTNLLGLMRRERGRPPVRAFAYVLTLAYFRRACRTLGWSYPIVVTVLGTLLVVDLIGMALHSR